MVRQAVETFGGLDVLVNNAGFLRDRMLVNASEDEWDAVIRVHLKGHFATLRHAASYWRDEAKAGRPRQARIVNTSSGAGLQGSIGQATYSAAKAGIAGLTLVAAAELGRYGVTVNALAPAARTRMTEAAFAETMAAPEDGFDAMHPTNVAPLVAWLASDDSGDVTGRVIESEGGKLCVEEGWRHGPSVDIGRRWDPADVGPAVRDLLKQAAERRAGLRHLLRARTVTHVAAALGGACVACHAWPLMDVEVPTPGRLTAQMRSMIVPLAIAPPAHIVTSALDASRRSSSCRAVVSSRVPVEPTG